MTQDAVGACGQPDKHARLDVVIVNWNAGGLLDACVRSLAQARSDTYLLERVMIVDNASSDGSADGLVFPDLRLFYNLRSRMRFARKHFRPTAQIVVVLATEVIEPLSRLARAVSRGSMREARHVAAAVTLLWGTALLGAAARLP